MNSLSILYMYDAEQLRRYTEMGENSNTEKGGKRTNENAQNDLSYMA